MPHIGSGRLQKLMSCCQSKCSATRKASRSNTHGSLSTEQTFNTTGYARFNWQTRSRLLQVVAFWLPNPVCWRILLKLTRRTGLSICSLFVWSLQRREKAPGSFSGTNTSNKECLETSTKSSVGMTLFQTAQILSDHHYRNVPLLLSSPAGKHSSIKQSCQTVNLEILLPNRFSSKIRSVTAQTQSRPHAEHAALMWRWLIASHKLAWYKW